MQTGCDHRPKPEEREILDIVYRIGERTVEWIRTELPDASHYSTVRALLRVLEEKDHLVHGERNLRYIYQAVMPKPEAAQLAVDRVLTTFFEDSAENLLGKQAAQALQEAKRAGKPFDLAEFGFEISNEQVEAMILDWIASRERNSSLPLAAWEQQFRREASACKKAA